MEGWGDIRSRRDGGWVFGGGGGGRRMPRSHCRRRKKRIRGARGGRGDLVALVVVDEEALDLSNHLGVCYDDAEGRGSLSGPGVCRNHRSLRVRSTWANGDGAQGAGRVMFAGGGRRLRLCDPMET